MLMTAPSFWGDENDLTLWHNYELAKALHKTEYMSLRALKVCRVWMISWFLRMRSSKNPFLTESRHLTTVSV